MPVLRSPRINPTARTNAMDDPIKAFTGIAPNESDLRLVCLPDCARSGEQRSCTASQRPIPFRVAKIARPNTKSVRNKAAGTGTSLMIPKSDCFECLSDAQHKNVGSSQSGVLPSRLRHCWTG